MYVNDKKLDFLSIQNVLKSMFLYIHSLGVLYIIVTIKPGIIALRYSLQ